jgi:hypothetical protein
MAGDLAKLNTVMTNERQEISNNKLLNAEPSNHNLVSEAISWAQNHVKEGAYLGLGVLALGLGGYAARLGREAILGTSELAGGMILARGQIAAELNRTAPDLPISLLEARMQLRPAAELIDLRAAREFKSAEEKLKKLIPTQGADVIDFTSARAAHIESLPKGQVIPLRPTASTIEDTVQPPQLMQAAETSSTKQSIISLDAQRFAREHGQADEGELMAIFAEDPGVPALKMLREANDAAGLGSVRNSLAARSAKAAVNDNFGKLQLVNHDRSLATDELKDGFKKIKIASPDSFPKIYLGDNAITNSSKIELSPFANSN